MELISYNAELGTANLLFARLFNNIRIERTDTKGNKSQIKVHCTLGQRSRILKNIENPERRGNMKVPMIVISRQGYSRQPDRLNNLHNEVKYELNAKNRNYHLMTPVPIDIEYQVTIIAKYPEDIDKIASNFMVFFNNDLYVSCEHPKYEGIIMNNQVVMSDSVSEDHPDEIDAGTDDLITSTFNFTFKTYLFAGTHKARRNPTLSTYLSTILTSDIIQLHPNDVADFMKEHPDAYLSAELTSYREVKLTTEIDDGNGEGYDDGIPLIRNIHLGFYTVPLANDFAEYTASVDNELLAKHYHYEPSSYISTDNDGTYYDVVDNYCTLAPYVDKLIWEIDGDANTEFPYRGTIKSGCFY